MTRAALALLVIWTVMEFVRRGIAWQHDRSVRRNRARWQQSGGGFPPLVRPLPPPPKPPGRAT